MSDRQLAIIAGAPMRAIMPSTFDEVARIANMAVMAGYFKHKDQDTAKAQATMAIMQGLEAGIPPMQAVQNIAVINGRACIWGDLVVAILRRDGCRVKEWFEGAEYEPTFKAWCEITRSDGEIICRSFSVADAKEAGLWDERPTVKRKNWDTKDWEDKPNDSPWFRFKKRMLSARARGYASRDGAADMLRGLYSREEMEDAQRIGEALDITPAKKGLVSCVPPPAPEIEEQTSEESSAVDPIADIGTALAQAATETDIDEIWTERLEETCALPRKDRDRADSLYELHIERVRSFEAANAA